MKNADTTESSLPHPKTRCQSCGMPLGDFTDVHKNKVDNFGTNADESKNEEYCQMCFQKGSFTQPEMTVEDMVKLSVDYMRNKMDFSPEKAEMLSRSIIPTLARWRKK